MGLLRFLLALSVVLAHTSAFAGFSFVGGPLAVEAFFIISGFYITLILNEKYVKQPNSYWLFISNRVLRLYPFYWIILLISFLCAVFIPAYNEHAFIGDINTYKAYGNHFSFLTYAVLVLSNIFIVLQDVIMFLGVNLKTGSLYYAHSFLRTNPGLYRFELVQQAWSVAIELSFYIIAPFIVRNRMAIIILLIASAAAKHIGSHHGYDDDPFTYRFFPFELQYFLLGSVAFFIYKDYLRSINIPVALNITMLSVLGLLTIVYSKFNFPHQSTLYLALVFVTMPFLFKFTKNFKKDRFIGELSYPIYITHILVFNLIRMTGIEPNQNLLTIAGSIIMSLLLIRFVGNKIEQKRQARVAVGNDTQSSVGVLTKQN